MRIQSTTTAPQGRPMEHQSGDVDSPSLVEHEEEVSKEPIKLRFLESMSVQRTGKTIDEFTISWDWAEARTALSKNNTSSRRTSNKRTYLEFLQCPEGDASRAEPGKMFLDRDVYVGPDPPTPAVIAASTEEVIQNMQLIVDRMETKNNKLTFVTATRHGYCPGKKEYKLSFRPFVQGMSIRYTDIPRVIHLLGQDDFWDMSVYKPREQLLATINCRKSVHDNRVLTPQPGAEDPLLYVVQHVDVDWLFLDLPQDSNPQEEPSEVTSVQRAISGGEKVCPVFVGALVECLSTHSSDDRPTWLNVALVLKGLGESSGFPDAYLPNWILFSKKSASFKGERDCNRTWVGLTPRGACTLGTLCYYAMQDDNPSYIAAQSAHFQRIQALPPCAFVDDIEELSKEEATSHGVCALIKKIDPATYAAINPTSFTATLQSGRKMHLLDESCGLDAMMDYPTFTNFLNIKIEHFNQVCNLLGPELTMDLTRDLTDDKDVSQLRGMDRTKGLVLCTIHNMFSPEQSKPMVEIGGRPVTITKHQVKEIFKLIGTQAAQQVAAALGPCAGIWFQQINVQTVNVFVGDSAVLGGSERPTYYNEICTELTEFARIRRLRKRLGLVFQPVPGCPCAYVERCDYGKFVNEVLKNRVAFKSRAGAFKEAVSYLEERESDSMPELQTNRDLLSFLNGVLELSTIKFTRYDAMDLDEEGGICKQVARHHIPHPYTACVDTPLLDLILDAQFDKDVAEVLCALVGRCFFHVGQLDDWQVMPFMVGVGGTGKSLLLKVVQHLFARGVVGNLAAKREEVFGMANLVNKELVLGRDMPAKMSASLSQDIMQGMTAGEDMEIPCKGTQAMHVQWTSHVIMAGNHMPDYVNTGGNLSRRMVTIRFDNVIATPEDGLQARILATELPNFLCRCLSAYGALRLRVVAGGGFWKVVPEIMRQWKGDLCVSTNKLAEFFAMDDDARLCKIEAQPGRITWVDDFKAAFEYKMGKGSFVSDPAVFASQGFSASIITANVCKSCKQMQRVGCCLAYARSNKSNKKIITGMHLTRICAIVGDA